MPTESTEDYDDDDDDEGMTTFWDASVAVRTVFNMLYSSQIYQLILLLAALPLSAASFLFFFLSIFPYWILSLFIAFSSAFTAEAKKKKKKRVGTA